MRGLAYQTSFSSKEFLDNRSLRSALEIFWPLSGTAGSRALSRSLQKGTCQDCHSQDSNTALFCPTDRSYLFSLHYNFRRHLRMNRAEIAIPSLLRKLEAELVIGVEGLGPEGTILTNNGVRDVIAIYPSHFCPHRHSDGRRSESKVVYLHFRRGSGLLRRSGACRSLDGHNHSRNQDS